MVLMEPEGLDGLEELAVLHLPWLFILYAHVNVFILILPIFYFNLSCSSSTILTLIQVIDMCNLI